MTDNPLHDNGLEDPNRNGESSVKHLQLIPRDQRIHAAPGKSPYPERDAIMAQVCDLMAQGQSVRAICKANPDFPREYTIRQWGMAPEFATQYARAREAMLDFWADEIVDIADDTSRDTIETEKGEIPNTEWINRSRLRVDSRKWIMSKLSPRKFGDRIEVAGDPDAPLMQLIIRKEVKDAGSGA